MDGAKLLPVEDPLIEESRQADPRVTAAEIAKAIWQAAPRAKKNVVGFLLTALPKWFASGGLDQLRAAPPPESPRRRHDLTEQYDHLTALLSDLSENHEQRPELERQRAALLERIFAEPG